ncbi:kinase-like domain-containing protein [Rhizophagus diaphanus]|nr:kinase-like domain-containing protein [Rhizophagus diaphanus] [Rhizophagus sp. MUCL 43196]
MIIMPYYDSGDLINFITKDFYNTSWKTKLNKLGDIARGLIQIHELNVVHRDFHSGNIFFHNVNQYFTSIPFVNSVTIGDLGISKSATESGDDNNNENYGIIPYMAPEVFQGQKYTKASDIYSFGMIMWEFMTGRRPFWDRNHDAELIIEICDENPPKFVKKNPTKIIESSDIGPVTKNNPGAIYRSRPLSAMINSAMSLRSSRSQSINLEEVKRKFKDDLIEDNDDDGMIYKKLQVKY